ncbi:hypothetical protein BELL_1022g00030 [Botrytis elliptica]|uniref:Uncharacterized protein n=1 Tax=Botrytis elliptica TaxID=278938 RepID=A0A4Z1IUI3_9HELO|nr:hypothetical protein BELL_1022g00030 [Botrytis elliptica]
MKLNQVVANRGRGAAPKAFVLDRRLRKDNQSMASYSQSADQLARRCRIFAPMLGEMSVLPIAAYGFSLGLVISTHRWRLIAILNNPGTMKAKSPTELNIPGLRSSEGNLRDISRLSA